MQIYKFRFLYDNFIIYETRAKKKKKTGILVQ